MLALYKNIKKLRQQLNLSQDDLAKKIGYTNRSSIAKIEKGEVDLPLSKIILFAQFLHTTPAELMGWETNETTALYLEKHPLMQIYNNLNNDGQKILMAQAEFLNSQPQYKKCYPLSKQEIS